jgi:hypothetical protein
MESLTRLVSESMARHGFDRPVDYRRLHWSRWFRCESHHSLLSVPSRPGVFAVAEEIMDLSPAQPQNAASVVPRTTTGTTVEAANLRPEALNRRMLAVTKFFEDDDMAFTLDRMLSYENPMRARLQSGHHFIRYVIIQDQAQRRSICNALNQWIASSSELATGIGSHFASSLELPTPDPKMARTSAERQPQAPVEVDTATATEISVPSFFPLGF